MIRHQYKNSTLLFIGINPHPGSFSRGVPFSNNKLFWYLLSRAGLIKESRDELRDDLMLKNMHRNKFNKIYKLGLINIIDRPTRDISFLKKGEELKGRLKIKKVVETQKPIVVCFIGKATYEKYIGSKDIDFGWQKNIDESKVYVMHSPLRGEAIIRVRELKKIARVAFVKNNPRFLGRG